MGKVSKANGTAAGGWVSEEEWHFELIQPVEAPPVKSGINLDRQIARSPDHQIARILAALHLLPRGGESSAPFAGPRTALPRLPPPRQQTLVVMAATLTLQA